MMRMLIACCITCTALVANAQRKPFPDRPIRHGAPFDGGISLLIAAGAAYGAKKAYNKRMAEKS